MVKHAKSKSASPETARAYVGVLNGIDREADIQIKGFESGTELLKFLDICNRKESNSCIVDVQLALPPWLNTTDRWVAQSLIAIAHGQFQVPGRRVRTKYIFQVASGLMYTDDALVFPLNIQECTILYKMGDPPGFGQQPHLEPHQVQISALIESLLNAADAS
ncbi:hypothetical protein [Pseudomonas sp. EA_65y_Pfl2_P74]|uniref:hypothetical protein n=1 Tax=Pseudomonas sp. EA_65y_Pfl2_P74 TaxID=3088694 RepID=UPI0030DC9D06